MDLCATCHESGSKLANESYTQTVMGKLKKNLAVQGRLTTYSDRKKNRKSGV
jgi:hypothetical protein|tara:strand:+ start:1236 stop:1391 length:156 start_codon:yes stop_codon:yes gene_type:complete